MGDRERKWGRWLSGTVVWGVLLWGGTWEVRGAGEKVRVVLDSDLSADPADAGALAVLHALADAGEAEIAGVVLSGGDADGAGAATADAINTYYGRGEVPLGVARGRGVATRSAFTAAVRDGFPHDEPGDGEVETGAVELYRKLLAAGKDGGTSIVCVGFLTNLRGLLESGADGASKLDGAALVRAKVRRLTVAGGAFPGGSEYQFRGGSDGGRAGDAAAVFGKWPKEVEVVFAGFEVGKDVRTGVELAGAAEENPVKKAYELGFESLKYGRPSWDQVAVLSAVRGQGDYWDAVGNGVVKVEGDGSNRWEEVAGGNQKYLVRKMGERALGFEIGELMGRPPGLGGKALVGHWKLEEDGKDSALGNHGKLRNGAEVSVAEKNGKKALVLDGEDDVMEIPAAEVLALAGYSVAVWVRPGGGGEGRWRTLYEHGRETDNWFGLWRNQGGGQYHFRWGRSDTVDFSGKVREGEWQHVVATVDAAAGEVRVYLDGKLDRKVEGIRVPRPAAQKFTVGSNVLGEEYFPGMVRDLRVYRRPLTDAEVGELAKGGR